MQNKIIVRKPIQLKWLLGILLLASFIPLSLLLVYYYIKEIQDIKLIQELIDDKTELTIVEKKLQDFFDQYGNNQDALNLSLKLWEEYPEKKLSFEDKIRLINIASILIYQNNDSSARNYFLMGKLLYTLGKDYYPESATHLQQVNPFFPSLTAKEQAKKQNLTSALPAKELIKLDQANPYLKKTETLLFNISMSLKKYSSASYYANRLYQRSLASTSTQNSQDFITWKINLAKINLLLQKNNLAMDILEKVLLKETDPHILKEVGLLLINTGYILNLENKVDFYYNFLLEKKIITEKEVTQLRIDHSKKKTKTNKT